MATYYTPGPVRNEVEDLIEARLEVDEANIENYRMKQLHCTLAGQEVPAETDTGVEVFVAGYNSAGTYKTIRMYGALYSDGSGHRAVVILGTESEFTIGDFRINSSGAASLYLLTNKDITNIAINTITYHN